MQPEGGGPEVFIPIAETHRALHGDRVEYRVVREARGTWLDSNIVPTLVARPQRLAQALPFPRNALATAGGTGREAETP